GYVGIGHTRYSTIGGIGAENAQPFLVPSPFGIMMAHNGNVFNSYELRREIFEKDHRLINSDNDVEVLLTLLAKTLSRETRESALTPAKIWKAVESVHKRAKGAYSVVAYIAGYGLLAFRDPHGIRPLLFGKRETRLVPEYMFASESIALDLLGFEVTGYLAPGEAVFVDEKTREVHRKAVTPKIHTPCIFEHIYFARPDSMLDGISVHKTRLRMGEAMVKKIKAAKLKIDVVMPVPDSSRTSAMALAEKMGIKYREGLIKNRYIGRTFIMPGQAVRKKSIRYKLNPIRLEIEGKRILLVDDSIVRGNTSRKIVQIMKEAGAKAVYFASYAPPITHPCLYGIDIPTFEELIAAKNTVEEIRKFIGADQLFYGDIAEVKKACLIGNPKIKDMCMACFDGRYKTGDIDEKVLKANAESRLTDKGCESPEGPPEESEQMNLV
ncbi:amidophosphoribosyltransferase, partial [Candidatus Peregrinibacteria bacterium]|nr:amidophosphoribosyltransferase [Candidatus Peregrinibacteria bacterium]